MTGRLYDRQRWHRCRARKLSRTPVCEGCEQRPSRHVDHIKPLSEGGAAYDPANWMSLCVACHNAKTWHDRLGRHWTPPKLQGFHEDGTPRDPAHPWNEAGGRSITNAESLHTARHRRTQN
ncbi:MAG: HNH endonuclease signature motif containing protein [Pseudomonadota bacterium]